MLILDRPNPHGHHMQGPMLEPEFQSFVGFVPVPMVHGLTLGEAALMACGEGWIEVPESWRPVVILPTLVSRRRLHTGHPTEPPHQSGH